MSLHIILSYTFISSGHPRLKHFNKIVFYNKYRVELILSNHEDMLPQCMLFRQICLLVSYLIPKLVKGNPKNELAPKTDFRKCFFQNIFIKN